MRIRHRNDVLRPAGHLHGERLVARERLEAREQPVLALLLHLHELGVAERRALHVGRVRVDPQSLEQLAQRDAALARDAVGVAVVGEVHGIAERVHREAVHFHGDVVRPVGVDVGVGEAFHDDVILRDLRCLRGGVRRLLGSVREGQVLHVHVGSLLRVELVCELVPLELKAHLHAVLGGLHLNRLARLVGREEGDVVEQGVLVAVGIALVGTRVEGLHVRVVVVALAALCDLGHLEASALGQHGGVGERRGHLHGIVFVGEGRLVVLGVGLRLVFGLRRRIGLGRARVVGWTRGRLFPERTRLLRRGRGGRQLLGAKVARVGGRGRRGVCGRGLASVRGAFGLRPLGLSLPHLRVRDDGASRRDAHLLGDSV